MTIYPHRLRYTLVLIFSFLLFFNGSAAGTEVKRVLILPFAVHAEKDLSYLKKGIYDMLSSRLVQEGKVVAVSAKEVQPAAGGGAETIDGRKAAAMGRDNGADFVIFGSLTVFGESISTDASCVDVARDTAVVTFNKAGKSQGDVITHLNLFAARINEQVFGRKEDRRTAASPAEAVPEVRRHPEEVWKESKGGAFVYGSMATEGQAAFSAWKSRKFKGDIRGVSVGDVDNDGNNEVVFIGRHTIYIYRYDEGRFVRVVELPTKKYHNFLSLDVADINRNGIAEIYVVSLPVTRDTLSSFVMEWNGRTFEEISSGKNRYYRVVDMPNRGKVLLGQDRGSVNDTFGANELFSGLVSEYHWKNGRLEALERLLLPRRVNIYGFTVGDVLNDGGEWVAFFGFKDFVSITDREGNREWTSNQQYGGSATYMELRSDSQREGKHDNSVEKDRHFLPQRLHIADLDGDNKNELIVVNNHDATGGFLSQTRYYKSGHIEALTWDTLGMRIKWKTQKTGYISDYVIGDLNNDGRDEVAFSVVLTSGPILGKSRSYIGSLALKAPDAPQ